MAWLLAASWTGISSAFVAIGAFLAAATALSVVFRRPVKWVWRRLVGDPLSDWFRELIRHEVEPIVRELQPNGGKTVKDRVDQIAAAIPALPGGRRASDPPKENQ